MQANSDAQIIDLVNMQQGQFMNVVLSSSTAGGNCFLEFKNGSDTAWTIDPNFTGVVTGGILSERVKCLSALTRLRFSTDPAGTPYHLSVVWDAVPNF